MTRKETSMTTNPFAELYKQAVFITDNAINANGMPGMALVPAESIRHLHKACAEVAKSDALQEALREKPVSRWDQPKCRFANLEFFP